MEKGYHGKVSVQVWLLPIVTNMTRMGFKGTELYGQYTLCRDFHETNFWKRRRERIFVVNSVRFNNWIVIINRERIFYIYLRPWLNLN